ncbi:syntaphilin-like isoform X2 [Megalops cyprinoides]|uniref:syntaphilin-like isoform X2 n=1 Tax=Megalops cyprinoides TaxID=118141 RepID=UPI001864474E|nr:syntaphilin-like isoform X2 [Megalops cyprinoides]
MSAPVNRRPSAGSRRYIELDCVPMETGYMVSMRPTHGHVPPQTPERHRRRTAVPASTRDGHGHSSLSSSTSGSCRGSDSSPTARPHPGTPRRNVKYTSCSDNHGIRPPPPEQYLTPLQQKEVCIRHLRAKLKENIERLQDRDSEIEELRTQLSRMQEDWIEEECHRVEAQLALKEARREIRQLKQVVEVVRTNLSSKDTSQVHKYFQDISVQNRKLDTLLHSLEDQDRSIGGGGPREEEEEGEGGGGAGPVRPRISRSCEGSPARSLTRSSTYTKLSNDALLDQNGNGADFPGLSGEETQDSGFVCGDSRADLLLDTLLSEEPPSVSLLGPYAPLPRSFTYEKLCSREAVLPVAQVSSSSQPCLSHHHLYLHHLQERAIQTEHSPPRLHPDLDSKSQSCSPTFTWISEEGEDLETVTTATATEATEAAEAMSSPAHPLPPASPMAGPGAVEVLPTGGVTEQPKRQVEQVEPGGVTVVVVEEEEEEEKEEEGGGAVGGADAGEQSSSAPQKSYWSRHFLVDLLAVVVPVVPAVAWLCRGPRRPGQPIYNISSLLRSCCAVALHSLRRTGAPGRGPVSGRGGTQI